MAGVSWTTSLVKSVSTMIKLHSYDFCTDLTGLHKKNLTDFDENPDFSSLTECFFDWSVRTTGRWTAKAIQGREKIHFLLLYDFLTLSCTTMRSQCLVKTCKWIVIQFLMEQVWTLAHSGKSFFLTLVDLLGDISMQTNWGIQWTSSLLFKINLPQSDVTVIMLVMNQLDLLLAVVLKVLQVYPYSQVHYMNLKIIDCELSPAILLILCLVIVIIYKVCIMAVKMESYF